MFIQFFLDFMDLNGVYKVLLDSNVSNCVIFWALLGLGVF